MNDLVTKAGDHLPAFSRQNVIDKIMRQPAIILRRQLHTFLQYLDAHHVPLFDLAEAHKHRAAAIRRCERMPTHETLRQALNAFHAATYGETDEAAARAAAGAMLDALPSSRNFDSGTYVDAMVDALLYDDNDDLYRGFTAPVVALGARCVLQTETYVPPIALFLDRARKERGHFRQALVLTDRLVELRVNAEEVLFETGDLSPASAFEW